MTLEVPFDEFAPTVKRMLGIADAYLRPHLHGTLATAGNPEAHLIVVAITDMPPVEAEAALERVGLAVWHGAWSIEGQLDSHLAPHVHPYIGAVAYHSSEDRPGLWVDAFQDEPSEIGVMEAMYHEFNTTGQIEGMSFEEFLAQLKANVVILSPSEQAAFLAAKADAEAC